MKTAELKKELAGLGAVFIEGTKHTKVYLNGKQQLIPRHREIPNFFAKEIKKRLGVI